jgi:phospholipase C
MGNNPAPSSQTDPVPVHNRREFLRASTAAGMVGALVPGHASIGHALGVAPHRAAGSIADVAHIVVLTQENRSFDHYFGSLPGVRGFGDRFAIPVAPPAGAMSRNVWQQSVLSPDAPHLAVQPFHLDTVERFELMRAEGTPHSWLDAQQAWDHGRMGRWTAAKGVQSMGHYAAADLPFQVALANAFTVCDAYHCAFQGGTNTNRLFLWSGTNDPMGRHGGPATYNDLDTLAAKPGVPSYTWTTYAQRLQAAGIHWQVYQNLADNFDDNPLAGFKVFRDAVSGASSGTGHSAESRALQARAFSTRDLDQLRADVMAGALPQVSWIVAGSVDSEHPEPSSPAQGANFTERVLLALTSNPEVWARTVLIINYDENDGFFDHVPPPAPPSYEKWHADPAQARLAGGSTVSTRGEYHEHLVPYRKSTQEQDMLHRPYGLGPRVPMLLVSPWSRGGWVNSQVFDHTSVIRFMEQRFKVLEPNISAWRRAVCGDLTSAFDFSRPDLTALPTLPPTAAAAKRALGLPQRTLAHAPAASLASWGDAMALHRARPRQARGTRPSRALPYVLHADARLSPDATTLRLDLANCGRAGAVFHVYDRLNLERIPRRYTVEAGKQISGSWPLGVQAGAYDLWLLGPNGFHRHFAGACGAGDTGARALPEVVLRYRPRQGRLALALSNRGALGCDLVLQANAYDSPHRVPCRLGPHQRDLRHLDVRASANWYDFSVLLPVASSTAGEGRPAFLRRFAGRMETGAHSVSDPAWDAPEEAGIGLDTIFV